MQRERNFTGSRFDSMNALEAAHELLKRKRPPVFADGHDLCIENERIPLKIATRNLDDFRKTGSNFGKAPAPDSHPILFFVNLNPRPIVFELKRNFSFVGCENFTKILKEFGEHTKEWDKKFDAHLLEAGRSVRESNRGDLGKVRKKQSGAPDNFQIRTGSAGDCLLNQTVVETDAELIVKQAQQNGSFQDIHSLDQLFESAQFFPARAFAAGFGDLGETIRDIFEGERH